MKLDFWILRHYDIITISYWKLNFRFEIRVSNLVSVPNFISKSWIDNAMWPQKNTYNFDNWPKRFGKFRNSSLIYFLVLAVLYRKIVENINQMHENPFFCCSFNEVDLMTSSVWSRGANWNFWDFNNSHKCLVRISTKTISSVKNCNSFNFTYKSIRFELIYRLQQLQTLVPLDLWSWSQLMLRLMATARLHFLVNWKDTSEKRQISSIENWLSITGWAVRIFSRMTICFAWDLIDQLSSSSYGITPVKTCFLIKHKFLYYCYDLSVLSQS